MISEVLEHVEQPDHLVEQAIRLLVPGGHIFLTTLNRTVVSRLLGVWAAENVLGIVPRGVHDWQLFITPAEVEAMLQRGGARPLSIQGLRYNLFTNAWSWTWDTSINYAICALKNGWLVYVDFQLVILILHKVANNL